MVNAELLGSRPFGAWFGLKVSRTLALFLKNTGSAPTSSVHVFVTLDSTPVYTGRLPGISPGQVRSYLVRVTFPALSVGNLSLYINVDRGGGQLDTVMVPAAQWPFGLLIVALAIAQLALVVTRNAMRRRYERKHAPSPSSASKDDNSRAPDERITPAEPVQPGV